MNWSTSLSYLYVKLEIIFLGQARVANRLYSENRVWIRCKYRYVWEWHSHPRKIGVTGSVFKLKWLRTNHLGPHLNHEALRPFRGAVQRLPKKKWIGAPGAVTYPFTDICHVDAGAPQTTHTITLTRDFRSLANYKHHQKRIVRRVFFSPPGR